MEQKVCERERERRRDEGQGCNWWETWPTPPSLHWSGSMPLSMPASPPSIHSCLHRSLHFSHSVLFHWFWCVSYSFYPFAPLFTPYVSILLAPTPFLPASYPLRHNWVKTLSVIKQTSKVTYKYILLTQLPLRIISQHDLPDRISLALIHVSFYICYEG